MVQRKELSTRGDQDGKNKGTELKKKMKKSRSIKLSHVEGLRSSSSSSSPLRKSVAQPGKPPPLNVLLPAATTTPQKKPLIKAMDGSPNYMKSTSSSKAKEESSKVSSRNSLTASNSKNQHRRSSTGSKTGSGSCNKPVSARTLTRTSSFKLVRSLTKSPSFKPARASAKKCSKVALCTDMNVHRATCSSTLKDSKFPSYLELNHGTESEGTSIIKVCPYTYCSLNGHHHAPLPPLKCFLKARRRSMKTQRSMKIEPLSPRRLKPSSDGTEVLNEKHVVLPKEPTSNGVDFFIEIFAKSKGNDAEATKGSTQMNAKGTDDPECGNETALEHDIDTPVSESLSEGSPHSEIDFDENFMHGGAIIPKADDDIIEILHKELKNLTGGDEQEGVSSVDVDLDHTMFDVIDMEWEEWQFSASEPDYEAQSSMECDLDIRDSSESRRNNLRDEVLISSDESDSNIAKEVPADGAEDSSTEEMFEVQLGSMKEENEEENIETDLEEENEDHSVIGKPGDSQADQTVTISVLCPENKLPSSEMEADKVANAELLIGIHDSSCVLPGADEDDIKVEANLNNHHYEVNNAIIDETISIQDTTVDESQDHLSDSQHKNAHVEDNQTGLEEDQDQDDNHNNRKWTIGRKRDEENYEEPRKFNPREPNFLPVVPEPDAEKVDLRHQMMDERKNAEDWMLDHALRQAVTKLAPARKRKVALLVEAFETVLPITKCETQLRHTSTGFARGRHIQACN